MNYTLNDPQQDLGYNYFENFQNSTPVQGNVALNRATRWHLALGETSPGVPELENQITTGSEPYIQEAAAAATANRVKEERQKQIIAATAQVNTPQQAVQMARGYLTPINIDHEAILEQNFSDRYLQMFLRQNEHTEVVQNVVKEDPEVAKQIVSGTQHVASLREVARTVLEDANAKYEGQGWGTYAWNFLKTMIPTVSASTMSPDWNPLNIVFPGTSLREERAKFYSFLDVNEAKRWLKSRVDAISATNPIDAITYSQAMLELPSGHEVALNTFGLTDTQGLLSVGKAAVSAAVFRRMMRQSLDGIAPDGAVTVDRVQAAGGNLKEASRTRAVREILAERDPAGQSTQVLDYVPNIARPGSALEINPGDLTRERSGNIVGNLKQNASQLTDVIGKGARAQRIPEEAIKPLMDEAEELVRLQRPSINDSVLDVRPLYDRNLNIRHAEIVIGDKGGYIFRNDTQAENYATRTLGLDPSEFRLVKTTNDDPLTVSTRAQSIAQGLVQDKATQFRTSQGSIYKVMPDGTTVRTKAARAEHPGDEGLKPQSKRTVYMTREDANKISLPEGVPVGRAYRFTDKDGAISVITRTHEVPWHVDRINFGSIKYSNSPREGLIPVEFWKDRVLGGQKTYGEVHFGNEIVSVKKPTQRQIQFDNAIRQQGGYWYISIIKPLNETGDLGRSLQLATNNVAPSSLGNWLLGGLARSAEDQLPYFQRSNRHVALHVPQEVQRVMVDIAKRIGKMSKESRTQLQRVLDANKDYLDYSMPPELQRGRAFRSQQALEKNWLDINKRPPTDQESLAYWSYHQLMDTDWVLRNFGVVRDLARQGVEKYTFNVADGVTVSVPGRFEKELPWNSRNQFSVVIMDADERKILWSHKMTETQKEAVDSAIKEGRQIIQIANPADRPLMQSTNIKGTVNYVIVKEHKASPLDMKQVDYAPGVHVMYPQAHFVKQPIIEVGEFGMKHYYGDRTLFAVDTEAEAKRIGDAVTKLQTMFKNLDSDANIQAFIDRNLPEDVDFWRQKFYGGNGQPRFLTLDQPIGNTYSGKTFFDTRTDLYETLRKEGLRNERNTEFNLYRAIDMDFMANRDGPINTVTRTGSPELPMYKLERARTLDPYVSINRALGNSIRNLYLNDYKIGAIEQWVRQFAQYMTNPDAALKNPFHAFYHPDFNTGVVDRAALASADNTRERIINFLGVKTELGRDLDHVQQKLMNWMGEKGARWYNDHELRFIKDPVSFLRSWMFDFRFGFFNPKQFIVQAQGFTHIYGVAGLEAANRGSAAYILQRALSMTEEPAIIAKAANVATKFGWKKEHFIESYKTMRSLGFDIVGREHSLRDEAFDPKLFTGKAGAALEWGRTPFVEGERAVRIGAWNTAYHEWRKANPTKRLNEFDTGKILTRADDLALNMTKASHSAIQEGLWSVPSQFYTFSHRIMEQFWGGRLTGAEKARAFITHSALYGVPVAVGAAIPWPFYDEVRKHMLENNPGTLNETWFKLATDGFMNHAISHVTGTEYNAGTRYGPGFSDAFKKVVDGEMPLIEGVLGATGSFLNAMWKATYPFRANTYLALTGQQERFPLTKEDLMAPLREISSVNDAYNAWYVINTGKYLSKNETFIADKMTAGDAAAIIAGLTRRDITDARLMIGSLKDQREAQKRAQDLGVRELKRAFEHAGNNDWQKFEQYTTRAKALFVIGDLQDDQIAEGFKRATTEAQPLVDRIRLEFTRRGYKSQLPQRLQLLFDAK